MSSADQKSQSPNGSPRPHPNEKHLEFLQNNISRMNQCSFQMKGWSITIVSALLAVFASSTSSENSGNKIYLLTAVAATFLFWCLDSFYLSKERKLIGIYNDLIGVGNGEKQTAVQIREYEIPLDKYNGCHYCILRAIFSPSEVLLYGAMTAGLLLLYHIL